MEILIILVLIILNGIFAMAEIAVVSSRKSKLQQQAKEGNKNAEAALQLLESQSRFLSTVQVGITFIGIFAGAFGGGAISSHLADYLKTLPYIAPYSEGIALLIVVSAITYLSLVIGELVPKRLALSHPEVIAKIVARPMKAFSSYMFPLVTLLSYSTEWIVRLLQIKQPKEANVSEEEVRMLIREGTRSGVFNIAEKDIVERTFKLSDKKVNTIMTSRKEIVWLDIDSSFKTIKSKLSRTTHSYFPVCQDNIDKVIGVVRTEDVLTEFLAEEKIDIKKSLLKPVFVPISSDAFKVLEQFRKSGIHMALVIDEYGSIQGLITLTDVMEEIVGDIPKVNHAEDKDIRERDDGSFLVDGLLPIDKFRETFRIKRLSGEKSGAFHTVGGFVMSKLGRIPTSGDSFEIENYKIEVVDMDSNRVDKVLLIQKKQKQAKNSIIH